MILSSKILPVFHKLQAHTLRNKSTYSQVPRINYEKFNGRKYRYFYAICSDVDRTKPGTVSKALYTNLMIVLFENLSLVESLSMH